MRLESLSGFQLTLNNLGTVLLEHRFIFIYTHNLHLAVLLE